jgi:hypothetical protein
VFRVVGTDRGVSLKDVAEAAYGPHACRQASSDQPIPSGTEIIRSGTVRRFIGKPAGSRSSLGGATSRSSNMAGYKSLEAAHVKDVPAIVRWAENQ